MAQALGHLAVRQGAEVRFYKTSCVLAYLAGHADRTGRNAWPSSNPVLAESLLDRLINTSHQVFMNGPSYRSNKRPGRTVAQSTTNAK